MPHANLPEGWTVTSDMEFLGPDGERYKTIVEVHKRVAEESRRESARSLGLPQGWLVLRNGRRKEYKSPDGKTYKSMDELSASGALGSDLLRKLRLDEFNMKDGLRDAQEFGFPEGWKCKIYSRAKVFYSPEGDMYGSLLAATQAAQDWVSVRAKGVASANLEVASSVGASTIAQIPLIDRGLQKGLLRTRGTRVSVGAALPCAASNIIEAQGIAGMGGEGCEGNPSKSGKRKRKESPDELASGDAVRKSFKEQGAKSTSSKDTLSTEVTLSAPSSGSAGAATGQGRGADTCDVVAEAAAQTPAAAEAPAHTPLPPGSASLVSDSSSSSSESSDSVASAPPPAEPAALPAAQAVVQVAVPPMPIWEQHWDEGLNLPYWWNGVTEEAAWEKPSVT